MPHFNPNGSPAPAVALASFPTFSDGWPSGPQAILLELAAVALLWLVLKTLFDALTRACGA